MFLHKYTMHKHLRTSPLVLVQILVLIIACSFVDGREVAAYCSEGLRVAVQPPKSSISVF